MAGKNVRIQAIEDFEMYFEVQYESSRRTFVEKFKKFPTARPSNSLELIASIKKKIQAYREKKAAANDLDASVSQKLDAMDAKIEILETIFMLKTHNKCLHEIDFTDLLKMFQIQKLDVDFYNTLYEFFEAFVQHKFFHPAKVMFDALKAHIMQILKGEVKLKDQFKGLEVADHVACLKYCCDLMKTRYLFKLFKYYHNEDYDENKLFKKQVEMDAKNGQILKQILPASYDLEDPESLPLRVVEYESVGKITRQILEAQENLVKGNPEYRKRLMRLNSSKHFYEHRSFIYSEEQFEDFSFEMQHREGQVIQFQYQMEAKISKGEIDPKMIQKALDIWTKHLIELNLKFPDTHFGWKEELHKILNGTTDQLIRIKQKSENPDDVELCKLANKRIKMGEEYFKLLKMLNGEELMCALIMSNALGMVRCSQEILKDSVLVGKYSNKIAKTLKQFPQTYGTFFKHTGIHVDISRITTKDLAQIVLEHYKI